MKFDITAESWSMFVNFFITTFVTLSLYFILSHPNGFMDSCLTVTAYGDGNETIMQKIVKVKKGAKASFIVHSQKGYVYSKSVGGTCPIGSWKDNTYTTGVITKKCNTYFTAVPQENRVITSKSLK